jgi:hypothetical protein
MPKRSLEVVMEVMDKYMEWLKAKENGQFEGTFEDYCDLLEADGSLTAIKLDIK